MLARAFALGVLVILASAGAPANVNVSRLPGLQSSPAVAIDPSDERVLVAGSTSIEEGTMRIYSSTDGGITWSSTTAYPPPAQRLQSCSSDAGVAIAGDGRQYYSFGRASPCREGAPQRVYVISRPSASAPWSRPVQVAPLAGALFDDKPAIAADTSPVSPYRGRVYVVWTRATRAGTLSVRLSRSDDGGRSWAAPIRVNRGGIQPTYAALAVARNGTVYVAWDDMGEFGIWIARSTDGGATFHDQRKVASFVAVTIPHCGAGIVIPAQPRTCVNANPSVSVDSSGGRYSGRVYVSYARTEFRGRQAAYVAIFDARLRRLYADPETGEGRPIAPRSAAKGADQFWPESTVDPVTGTVWACFYDTLGDPARRRAFFSCTLSRDGGATWARPVRVASVASDATQRNASGHYGVYQGLAAASGVAHPMWTDTRDVDALGEEIYTAR
ncbi:MAG: hypothetical protein C4307_03555, partial [Chloroflexota bacterium]